MMILSRPANNAAEPEAPNPAAEAAVRAARIWAAALPAPADHRYLATKQVLPLALRMDARGHLVVPLQDVDGALHSLETIAPDGAKRYLAGGAKRGHFCVVGAEPAPLAEPTGPLLICEGWATGASLHMATGHCVIAAMDAGNLLAGRGSPARPVPRRRSRPRRRQRRQARPRHEPGRGGRAQGGPCRRCPHRRA